MYSELSLWQLALIATIMLSATARNHLQSDESSIDEARRLYSEGKIDKPELERRLGEAVDDSHEQIRLVYVRENL